MGVLIAVAGSVGSGKTTLTSKLAERFSFQPLYEDTADNPYLADFYKDMRRYGLALQLRFLAIRVQQTREFQLLGRSAVQDRTCYEDAEVFARNLYEQGDLDERDWETYSLVAKQLLDGLSPPDLLVYLRRSPEGCQANIRLRGREYEQAIPMPYLERLSRLYEDWYGRYTSGPKLIIEASEYDFLRNPHHLEALVARITEALPQRMLSFEGA